VQNSIQRVLGKYATFSGRASRPEFWYWILSVFIFIFILGLIDGAVIAPLLGFERFEPNAGTPLGLIATLALIIPNLAVGARRLHDTGRSGWWQLIGLVPMIGLLVLMYFFVQPSDEATNDYGEPDPLES
jgi:uncharacterized membrane protein YhaH (DUF805 family)